MSRAKAPQNRQRHGESQTVPAPGPVNLAPAAAPDAPEHLGPDGRRYWTETWAAGAGFYRPDTDAGIIDRYASLQERRLHLLQVVEAEGFTTEGSKGQMIAHPAARLLSDVESKLTPLEDRLGLSPESRARLGSAAVELKTRLDVFLAEDS